ncbi:MAG: glycoside hydrolase family 13 protein [Eubacteriales bacterium]|nr:glycoside hydrolase family 13 protein [Eubacteriales bacterium]
MLENEKILAAIFSDETVDYRCPSEPDFGDTVTIRIRTLKDSARRVMLYVFGSELAILMKKTVTGNVFDWYEGQIVSIRKEVEYCFFLECADMNILYDKTGAHLTDGRKLPERAYAFRFTPGFHVPAWAKGAVQYQIFTDRFNNGSPDNDVTDNEYYYVVGHSRHVKDWSCPPDDTDIRTFYGGDLQGVMQKLDYLQDLGVEVIYFNPLFVSPSSHKYDTQDYDYIDPHFAVITEDNDHEMQFWEKHNGYASRYIKRVTSKKNLEESNAYFADFCRELHRRGMKIILDGVFNHCGSFNKWMDREGIYLGKSGYERGAFQDQNSPYRKYFRFSAKGNSRYADYEGWWGHDTLPKLNYEGSDELKEAILQIAEKWASPPYSIDGWRLDVAADLGHSTEFNHLFWKEFRNRIKAVNPDILIIAEHYGDPRDWLHGDEWDTVMNYDAFMDPVSFFLTGMEKHSDEKRDDLFLNGSAFFSSMMKNMAAFERPSLECAMNELSNHDHSRFLTRTNRQVGRLVTAGTEAAGNNVKKNIFRQAVMIQMTWPGAPTVYYADEAGQVGWTDPDNRRTYPWGKEDQELISYHKKLIAIRKEYPVLKNGSLIPLAAEHGVIAYARFNLTGAVIVAVNADEEGRQITVRAEYAGAADGSKVTRILISDADGYDAGAVLEEPVTDGKLSVKLPAGSAAIYVLTGKGE